jgi:hypothetical protein
MDTEESKNDQEKMREFVDEYNAICAKYKLQIVASPTWIITNHGSYELTIQMSINKFEPK